MKNEEKKADWEEYFEPLYANDLLHTKFNEQEWVVDKLIPTEGITVISGAPKSFKSWIALHIAICIEHSLLVFGKYKTTHAGVLIVDEENHLRITKNRLKMLGITPETECNLMLLNQQGFDASSVIYTNALANLCSDLDIKVVILDSLVRIHRSDENSAKDMAELFYYIKFLCQRGITVLILHHERKEGAYKSSAQSRMRGSSDISAAVDSHISVKKDPHDKYKIIVEHAQSRCAPEEDPFEIRFSEKDSLVEFQYIGKNEEKVKEPRSSMVMKAATEILKDCPEGMTHKDLIELVTTKHKACDRTIRSAIKGLLKDGIIHESSAGEGNKKILRFNNQPDN